MEGAIPDAVATAAREFGDVTALAEPDGPRLSYRQLHRRVMIVARALAAAGVAPGDRVAIWSPNTGHWVLGALGALSAGATLVPVSTRFTGGEALDVIVRSDARALLVADYFLGADRLAALRAAAAEYDTRHPERGRTGGCLSRLRLIVRVPVSGAGAAGAAPRAGAAGAGTAAGAGRVIDWAGLDELAGGVSPEAAGRRAAA
ncbi:MAG TPA: AMP-binding protein, partial [Streptosporangiaceae bacterium]|nr:AMP-binding protein [Streptosporangiaceae bacterium]